MRWVVNYVQDGTKRRFVFPEWESAEKFVRESLMGDPEVSAISVRWRGTSLDMTVKQYQADCRAAD